MAKYGSGERSTVQSEARPVWPDDSELRGMGRLNDEVICKQIYSGNVLDELAANWQIGWPFRGLRPTIRDWPNGVAINN